MWKADHESKMESTSCKIVDYADLGSGQNIIKTYSLWPNSQENIPNTTHRELNSL